MSLSNIGILSDVEEDVMEELIQYEDFVEVSFIQAVPQWEGSWEEVTQAVYLGWRDELEIFVIVAINYTNFI